MNHLDEYYARLLFDAILNFNSRLSNPVLSVCRSYMQESAHRQTFEKALELAASENPLWQKGVNPLSSAEIAQLKGKLGL
jgi:hypothetical protein